MGEYRSRRQRSNQFIFYRSTLSLVSPGQKYRIDSFAIGFECNERHDVRSSFSQTFPYAYSFYLDFSYAQMLDYTPI